MEHSFIGKSVLLLTMKMMWKSWDELRICLYGKLTGMLPVINSSCQVEEETLLSQKKNIQIQSCSEPMCSFNWLLRAAGPTADMLGSCYKKENCINLRRYKPNLFLTGRASKVTLKSVLASFHLPSQGEKCMFYCQSWYPAAVTGRGRATGTHGFFKAATWSCGNAKSAPSLLCLTAGGGGGRQEL